MKGKGFSLWCYGISIILFVFYIVVLINSMKTKVSIEYHMFYIEHKLAYYLKDQELQNYGVNEEFAYVSDGKYRNQGMGWGAVTDSGTWTQEKEAYIYFNIKRKSQSGYHLKISTHESEGKKLQVYVNGHRLEKREITNDGMVEVYLPTGCILNGLNEIVIETESRDDIQDFILVSTVEIAEKQKE